MGYEMVLWSVIVLLTISSIFSFYHFTNYLMITRISLLLSVFFIIIVLFSKTFLGKLYFNYVLESFKEVKFIKWPTKKETLQTTLIISVIVFLMGLILCL